MRQRRFCSHIHSWANPSPLLLSVSGLGVRVSKSIPIALPPPARNAQRGPSSDLAEAPPVVMTRVLVFESEVGGRPKVALVHD
jgi:hypothetical protein